MINQVSPSFEDLEPEDEDVEMKNGLENTDGLTAEDFKSEELNEFPTDIFDEYAFEAWEVIEGLDPEGDGFSGNGGRGQEQPKDALVDLGETTQDAADNLDEHGDPTGPLRPALRSKSRSHGHY